MSSNEVIWQKRLFWLIVVLVTGFVLLTVLTYLMSAHLSDGAS
jgi:hypothetical protein